ncbi:hypothetical protein [Tissierella praeacuta]|uniref:hypothetical protein n=1 Tax=Tissierella praeacuta TaxID=43131 RepID=UPI0028A64760|nr:hypothetical protein [Tissierella praeacuta]
MTGYCGLCQRPVQPVKRTGPGFWILSILTGGVWLLTYFFKKKRYCPLCKSKLM